MTDLPASERRDLSRLGGAKLGNYRLERVVGQGRMGVVYLATDEALLRPTAVKVLSWALEGAHDQDPVQWFLAEARLVARINHPRVVQIYAVARHGDLRYIAMEFVPGTSAEALVQAGGPLPERRALDVLLQAASALQAAHDSGVVHRDVKPANLLVAGEVAKLTDFGMALSSGGDRTGFAGLRVGTPHYTAPELWQGAPASPASDVYALGATGFFLLTGRTPMSGRDLDEVRAAHLAAPVPDPRAAGGPAISAACARLVMRAMAKGAEARFPSARELEEALREARDRLDSPAPTRARLDPAAAPAGHPAAASEPLDAKGVRRHLHEVIAAMRPGDQSPLFVTPDALMLVERRSQGRADRVTCLAENMLLLCVIAGRRIITTWEAWTAPLERRLTRAQAIAELEQRPRAWPPPVVAVALDVCRRDSGLPPYPRARHLGQGALQLTGGSDGRSED